MQVQAKGLFIRECYKGKYTVQSQTSGSDLGTGFNIGTYIQYTNMREAIGMGI